MKSIKPITTVPTRKQRRSAAAQRRVRSSSDLIPRLRLKDCWWVVVGLTCVYIFGVQWGIQVAHSNKTSLGHSTDDEEEVIMIRESLEAWSAVWESYVEPLFETVYDFASSSEDDLAKDNANDETSSMTQRILRLLTPKDLKEIKRKQHKPKWTPEIPQFTAPETLKLPKPIINVGFPKAGTSTIFSFFHCNGLKGQHWYCCEDQTHPQGTEHQHLMSRCILNNLRHNYHLNNGTTTTATKSKKYIFEDCGDYDFYSEINGPRMFQDYHFRQMNDDGTLVTRGTTKRWPRLILPQHHYLNEIHEQFPNATFLLNLRPTQEWVKSVLRWSSTLRQEIPNEFWYQDQSRGFHTFANNDNDTLLTDRGIYQLPPRKLSQLNKTLAYIMDYHTEFVRDFVRRHPSHTLMEVDISHNETGQLLANAFGLNESCWGHRNENRRKYKNTTTTDIEHFFNMGQFQNFVEQQSKRKMMLKQNIAEKKRQQQQLHKMGDSNGETIQIGLWGNVLWNMFGFRNKNDPKALTEVEEIPDQPMDLSDFERLKKERMEQRFKGIGPLPKKKRGDRLKSLIKRGGGSSDILDGWPGGGPLKKYKDGRSPKGAKFDFTASLGAVDEE